jgi:hypothetical protein
MNPVNPQQSTEENHAPHVQSLHVTAAFECWYSCLSSMNLLKVGLAVSSGDTCSVRMAFIFSLGLSWHTMNSSSGYLPWLIFDYLFMWQHLAA